MRGLRLAGQADKRLLKGAQPFGPGGARLFCLGRGKGRFESDGLALT